MSIMQSINNTTWTNILIKVNNESTHVPVIMLYIIYNCAQGKGIFEKVLLDVK